MNGMSNLATCNIFSEKLNSKKKKKGLRTSIGVRYVRLTKVGPAAIVKRVCVGRISTERVLAKV